MKKKCRKCGEEKDTTLFKKNSTCTNGIDNICKVCCAKNTNRRYYERKKEKEADPFRFF